MIWRIIVLFISFINPSLTKIITFYSIYCFLPDLLLFIQFIAFYPIYCFLPDL